MCIRDSNNADYIADNVVLKENGCPSFDVFNKGRFVVHIDLKVCLLYTSSSTFSVDMLPNVGTVTLLDSDQDNKYDVITIWSYELYYVSSKSSSEYSIVDNATRNTDKTLVLDPDADTNLDLVDKSGNEAVSYTHLDVYKRQVKGR